MRVAREGALPRSADLPVMFREERAVRPDCVALFVTDDASRVAPLLHFFRSPSFCGQELLVGCFALDKWLIPALNLIVCTPEEVRGMISCGALPLLKTGLVIAETDGAKSKLPRPFLSHASTVVLSERQRPRLQCLSCQHRELELGGMFTLPQHGSPGFQQSISVLAQGLDVVSQLPSAPLAFVVAAFGRLATSPRGSQVLILAPADRVAETVDFVALLARHLGWATLRVARGHDASGADDIVVSCPVGICHGVDPARTHCVLLVLADELLQFADQMMASLAGFTAQLAVHTETMHPGVVSIVEQHLGRQPVKIASPACSLKGTTQLYVDVGERSKVQVLVEVLEQIGRMVHQVAVCCNSRAAVEALAAAVEERGCSKEISVTYSGMSEELRAAAKERVDSGEAELLITDVDTEHVAHVINFELPQQARAYLGRVGQDSQYERRVAISLLVGEAEREQLAALVGDEAPVVRVEGDLFEALSAR